MAGQPPFSPAQLEALCKVLADTEAGLTGTEIGRLLADLGIHDPEPIGTKWKRLLAALSERQRTDGCANHAVLFILEAMNPIRYTGTPGEFESRRQQLNQVLLLLGFELGADGQLHHREAARTLNESQERARGLRAELLRRKAHPEVLRFCGSELLQENYFHALLEATKSLSERIRQKSGLGEDGGELANKAFSLGQAGLPFLAFNSLRTETERSEQSGLKNLFIGLYGTIRNPTAHGPRITWSVSEEDALDILTMISYLHRRLDGATPTGKKP